MALTGALVSVATTATAIATAESNAARRSYSVQNISSVDVYLGGSNVTTSVYGYKLPPSATLTIDLDRSEVLYACVASGTQNVAVMSAGLSHWVR